MDHRRRSAKTGSGAYFGFFLARWNTIFTDVIFTSGFDAHSLLTLTRRKLERLISRLVTCTFWMVPNCYKSLVLGDIDTFSTDDLLVEDYVAQRV